MKWQQWGGTNIPPLTVSEKTSYLEKFDASDNTYLDPKQTGLEEITTDMATNKRLDAATARASERETGIREAQLAGGVAELDPKYSGESISMAEFNRAKDWEAGRRPIADNAPIEMLPSDPNKINNLENTNYSLASPQRTYGISEYADKGGALGMDDPGFYQKGSVDFQQFTGGQTEFPNLQTAMATPELNTKGLDVGTGGEGSMWDSSFYRTKDGQLMKDSGLFGEDTIATQADIDVGITDQNASPWGSTAGWEAAGSVMKGVGGLASAYTGIKNYQLARDAFSTQKNQWQANYKQRLDAYQDNKDLMNEEIRRKNRTLKARGQAESYQLI